MRYNSFVILTVFATQLLFGCAAKRSSSGSGATEASGPPVFTSLKGANEASDGVVNASESVSVSALFALEASSFASASYTAFLDESTPRTCDATQDYSVSAMPSINAMTADGTFVVCVRLENADGTVAYGKSDAILRDTIAPPALTAFAAETLSQTSIKLTFGFPADVSDYASLIIQKRFGSTLPDEACESGQTVKTYGTDTGFTATDLTESSLISGAYSYRACARDLAGNVTSTPGMAATAKTLGSVAWSFSAGDSYTFDATRVAFSNGVASLIRFDQRDDDYSLFGFSGGTLRDTEWIIDALEIFDPDDIGTHLTLYYDFDLLSAKDLGLISNVANLQFPGTLSTTGDANEKAVAGKFGNALSFDGNDVITPVTIQDDADSTFAYSFWVKPTVALTGSPFVKGAAGSTACEGINGGVFGEDMLDAAAIEIHAGTNGISVCEHGTGFATVVAFRQASLTDWTHVAVSSFSELDMRLYVNGVEVDTAKNNGRARKLRVKVIGAAMSGGTAKPFTGMLDDVLVYRRTLADAEIEALHKSGRAFGAPYRFTSRAMAAEPGLMRSQLKITADRPYGKPLPNAAASETVYAAGNANMTGNVSLYHFDEASYDGTTDEVVDHSGGAHHLTRSGAAARTVPGGKFGRAAYLGEAGHFLQPAVGKHHTGVTDTFTMMFWAKADECTQTTVAEATSGTGGKVAGMCYAITPTHGATFGDQSTKAGAGVSVGANGVSVCEQSDAYMPCLLVHATALRGWNHIAVVYNNKVPSLYINGAFAKTGLTSTRTVHPSIEVGAVSDGRYPGHLDEFSVWNRALPVNEILDHYLRGAATLATRVRVCDEPLCKNVTALGPDGTALTFFDETLNTSASPATFDVSAGAGKQYFQYEVDFHAHVEETPRLLTVDVLPMPTNSYNPGTTSIVGGGSQAYSRLTGFRATVTGAGSVTYVLSPDNGTTWYWHSGTWAVSNGTVAQSNTAAQIAAAIGSFPANGNLKVKAFLTSDGTQAVGIDEIVADYVP